MLQPTASARPVITKRLCTEPSLTPLAFLNRASRTGPFAVMNHGTLFFAPLKVATAIIGFCAGLDPPSSGCAWQDIHWLELNRGPNPLFVPPVTDSTSVNLACPSRKNAVSSAVSPFSGPPPPDGPPRTPGSTAPAFGAVFAFVCPNAPTPDISVNANPKTTNRPTFAHTIPRILIKITVTSMGQGTRIVHPLPPPQINVGPGSPGPLLHSPPSLM